MRSLLLLKLKDGPHLLLRITRFPISYSSLVPFFKSYSQKRTLTCQKDFKRLSILFLYENLWSMNWISSLYLKNIFCIPSFMHLCRTSFSFWRPSFQPHAGNRQNGGECLVTISYQFPFVLLIHSR